ncbi:hypothetical protein MTYP_00167 [Methylophilaceae bacterium]|nr:hypothetical protein MTYP_00167 [Methylophilaceae bacterium]
MCITLEKLNEIEEALAEFRTMTNNPIPLLKDCFPDLSFIRLSASDIDEPPFRELDSYNLYLLDTREHCVQITRDPSVATGIVVAQL